MSHISTYKTKITNISLLLTVAKAQGHEVKEGLQMVNQFGRNSVEAIASIKLVGWRYPIAVTKEGELKYDHWGSKAGSMDALGALTMRYNEESIFANVDYSVIKNSYTEPQKDGSRKLVFEY